MKFITHLFIFTILLSPIVLFASTVPEYSPLVGLPGLNGEPLSASSDFNALINALYAIAIAVAALLAVIKVIIAGVKWMLTDIVTSKEEAKKDIKGALLGLLIVLSAVLILTVINPNLVNVDLSKTVMGEKYVPLVNTNPTPAVSPSGCIEQGKVFYTCVSGAKCAVAGTPSRLVCNPSLINSCDRGMTCDCDRIPNAITGSDDYVCDVVRAACVNGGGIPTLISYNTRISCGSSGFFGGGTDDGYDPNYIKPANVSVVDIGLLGEQYAQRTFDPRNNNEIISFKITVPSIGISSGDFRSTKTSYANTAKLVSISRNPGDYKNPVSSRCVNYSYESTRVNMTSDQNRDRWCILQPGKTYYINTVSRENIESSIPTCTTGGQGGDCSFFGALSVQ